MATANADSVSMRLVLDLRPGSSPISGVVHADAGVEQEFVGWTALASAIAAALTTHGGASDQPSMVADGVDSDAVRVEAT